MHAHITCKQTHDIFLHDMNSPGLDSLNLSLGRRSAGGEGRKGKASPRSTNSGRPRNLAEQGAAVQSLTMGVVCGAQRRRCRSSTRSAGGRKGGTAVGSTSEDKGGTNASHFSIYNVSLALLRWCLYALAPDMILSCHLVCLTCWRRNVIISRDARFDIFGVFPDLFPLHYHGTFPKVPPFTSLLPSIAVLR